MKNKEEKFRKIVEENEHKIAGICRYYSVNAEDMKDVYQEVLINIWKSLDTFRGEAKLSTWIYRIAVNTSIGFARKEIRRQKIFLDQKDVNLQKSLDVEQNNEKDKEILFQTLENQINQLSILDKIIVTLMLESVSYKEIASIVGLSEPNVRVKIHRIKNELKESLNFNS